MAARVRSVHCLVQTVATNVCCFLGSPKQFVLFNCGLDSLDRVEVSILTHKKLADARKERSDIAATPHVRRYEFSRPIDLLLFV